MSDDNDDTYKLEVQKKRSDIEEGAFDLVRAEAPSKEECLELFDHADKQR